MVWSGALVVEFLTPSYIPCASLLWHLSQLQVSSGLNPELSDLLLVQSIRSNIGFKAHTSYCLPASPNSKPTRSDPTREEQHWRGEKKRTNLLISFT